MRLNESLDFKGEIVMPDNADYRAARQIWNRAIQRYPIAIFYCTSKQDVIYAIKFAVNNDYKFRIRSGGHNYEGFSVGDNVIVIDVSKMKQIRIDYEKNIVKISAGVQNSELYEYVGSRGYPFPGGTCPTVGVTGYALGGGWGLSCRLFGLGADNLVEAELVDYKGDTLIANKDCNSELFWALRGAGGGNFGVVTSAIFRLPPKFNRVTIFTVYYPNSTAEEQAEIMDVFQNIYKTLDRRVNMRASFYNSKEEGIAAYLIGLFYGTEDELKLILEPFLVFTNAQANFKYTTFLEGIKEVEGIYPKSEKFKSTGTFASRIYSRQELLRLTNSLQQKPIGSVYAAITFYGLGGAVKDIRKNETAFYYRESNYIMGLQSVWEDSQYAKQNKIWVDSRLRFIKSITEGVYINFPYYPLIGYSEEYYGEHICRLYKVKCKYDPYNVFNFEQSIK